jgi:hypothetical protein
MMIRRAFRIQALALALAPLAAQAQDAPPAGMPATVPATNVDPARLAAARITVDHVFPTGTYARLMGAPMDKIMESMMGGAGQVPLRELIMLSGRSADEVARLDKATIAEIMAIHDPVYHQRMNTMMHTMMGQMGVLMTQIEPSIRDGMAQAYAAKFTVDQLSDMNRFFATPSGQAYASNAMALQMDPAVMGKMQGFVPMMIKQLPDIMKKVEAATAALPKPRTWDELTPAQRSRLAQLLGVPESQLAAQAKAKPGGTH